MLISFETDSDPVAMGAAYLKEYWSDGVMEFWKGIEKPKLLPIEGCITPTLQYSITPGSNLE